MIRTALIASLALGASVQAHAQTDTQVYVETSDLGSGIYMLATNRAGNVGVSVGEDGVFMIDTQMPQFAPAIDAAQRAVSGDRAVDLVLNTHLHGDHVLGNAYFAEQGATIMAHPSVRDALMNPVTAQLTGATPEPLSGAFLPTVGVNDGDVVTINGLSAR
ncbi:MAG TPA: MBL fold metallo-hydrolase, partial [Oceanicaulis sp.]|nr:MBL fold metallo-hydrolase [Oceanicaulis sp.]